LNIGVGKKAHFVWGAYAVTIRRVS